MIKDYFLFAYEGLKSRKLRSWLTMIGIFIGMASVVAIFALGTGLQTTINEQFEKLGTDKITILASGGFGPPGSFTSAEITEDDIKVVEKVRGIKDATGILFGSYLVEYNDEFAYLFSRGLETGNEDLDLTVEIFDIGPEEGRIFKKGDSKKVIIGYSLANEDDKFGEKVSVRKKLKINGTSFQVIGVAHKQGNPLLDNIIYIPIDDAREILNEPKKLNIIVAEVGEGFVMSSVVENIREEMRNDRDLDEDEEDFEVQTLEETAESFLNVFAIVQVVILSITAFSLLIGGIGIMNTMYTSVIERKKQIGIMKAVGARNSAIMSIFLFESGLLGMFGGLIGILLGIGIAEVVEYIGNVAWGTTLIRAEFPAYLLIGVLIFAFAIGCISGVVPAYQASKLKPVDTLRGK